jgi:hypothetical protein
LVRKRFDLTLPPELADMVDRAVLEERAFDVERFMPPRPVTAILESLIRQGLDFRRAREKLQTSQDLGSVGRSSEKGQKQPATSRKT